MIANLRLRACTILGRVVESHPHIPVEMDWRDLFLDAIACD